MKNKSATTTTKARYKNVVEKIATNRIDTLINHTTVGLKSCNNPDDRTNTRAPQDDMLSSGKRHKVTHLAVKNCEQHML